MNLQARLTTEMGNGEPLAPLGGDNRQAIQLVDLNGDGTQEAVAFFRDPAAEKPLVILLFQQTDKQYYKVLARIEEVGSEIESIRYLDLNGDGVMEVLVEWQASASVHTLVVYSISGEKPEEMMRCGYGNYLPTDLDGDGRCELFLTQGIGSDKPHVECWKEKEGKIELVSIAPLSANISSVVSWCDGMLSNGSPALFVTSGFGGDVLITDVLRLKDGILETISMDRDTGNSRHTYRYISNIAPVDINGDGITEVPFSRRVVAYASETDRFWWIDWMQYTSDGASVCVLTTWHNEEFGWYLELPAHWEGHFAMAREENRAGGISKTVFARFLEETEARPFLVITRLTGSDRLEQAKQGNRFILCEDGGTIYTGEFTDEGWNGGMSRESVIEGFHLGRRQ